MIIKCNLDISSMEKEFTDNQINGFMKDLDLTKAEAILYLWFYNYVGISSDDRRINNGREMYIKFAKAICKKLDIREIK